MSRSPGYEVDGEKLRLARNTAGFATGPAASTGLEKLGLSLGGGGITNIECNGKANGMSLLKLAALYKIDLMSVLREGEKTRYAQRVKSAVRDFGGLLVLRHGPQGQLYVDAAPAKNASANSTPHSARRPPTVEAEVVEEVPDAVYLTEITEVDSLEQLGPAFYYDGKDVTTGQAFAKHCGLDTWSVTRVLRRLCDDKRLSVGSEVFRLDADQAKAYAAHTRGFPLSEAEMRQGVWLLTVEAVIKLFNHFKSEKARRHASEAASKASQQYREDAAARAGVGPDTMALARVEAASLRTEKAVVQLVTGFERLASVIEGAIVRLADATLARQSGDLNTRIMETFKVNEVNRAPEGTVTQGFIRDKKFPGMNEDRVGEFLDRLDHPYKYYLGMEHESAGHHKRKAWEAEGVWELCDEVLAAMECTQDCPKVWRFTCAGFLDGVIQISKDKYFNRPYSADMQRVWGPMIAAHKAKNSNVRPIKEDLFGRPS